jgi:hypothetical protein
MAINQHIDNKVDISIQQR